MSLDTIYNDRCRTRSNIQKTFIIQSQQKIFSLGFDNIKRSTIIRTVHESLMYETFYFVKTSYIRDKDNDIFLDVEKKI